MRRDTPYRILAKKELELWQQSMKRKPTLINKVTKGVQLKINQVIPEKVHKVITAAIQKIVRAVLLGAEFTTGKRKVPLTFEATEDKVRDRISFYSSSAAAEGAMTGFGGFFLSLADFPLWLSLKMKMLFEIAALYGYDTKEYKERLYILYIFQLTFSSQQKRNQVYEFIADWDNIKEDLPDDLTDFDWRSFQLEYRDYIDLAKLMQLIPGVGAVAGAFVNHKLTNKLGKTAMNAYRLRSSVLKK